MIGVTGGIDLWGGDIPEGLREKIVKNSHGDVYLLEGKDFVFLPRHGKDRMVPPHKVNHKANIIALRDLGIEMIVSMNSVGSLRKEISPGSIVIPHDYINLWGIQTYYDSGTVHITPGLDEFLRKSLIACIKENARGCGMKLLEKGVYVQTTGPRLETRAEISLLKNYADFVGMTMASEATLARELDLKYASICSVDNYCNGVTEETLDFEDVIKGALSRRENLKKLLFAVIEGLK
jgi:5'-methylthioadenosine phosphorylase